MHIQEYDAVTVVGISVIVKNDVYTMLFPVSIPALILTISFRLIVYVYQPVVVLGGDAVWPNFPVE